MNPISFYTKLYCLLSSEHLPYWVLSPIRRCVRKAANIHLSTFLKRGCPLSSIEKQGLIVSFTSFPARIENVWMVVECMKRQTIVPEKIILWLSKEQFPNERNIPKNLSSRQDGRFEIRIVDGDVRSHKKYLYVCREYPDSLIFLIDDDIFYPIDIIEKSLVIRNKYQHSIICNYGSRITYNENGNHLSYNQWSKMKNDDDIFFGSGGGTLFCPSDMYADIVNEALALRLTPTADDIWLNTMARLAHVSIKHAYSLTVLPIVNDNNTNLSSVNNGQSQNDIQIEAIENYYGRCFDRK